MSHDEGRYATGDGDRTDGRSYYQPTTISFDIVLKQTGATRMSKFF